MAEFQLDWAVSKTTAVPNDIAVPETVPIIAVP